MFIEKSSGDFTPAPAGTHVAICYRFLDLGTQHTSYKGQESKKHRVMIGWELPNETFENGEGVRVPYVISRFYTWSMHEKASLRKDLESWRGRAFKDEDFGDGGFDTKNLLGKPCFLSIMHEERDGKTRANVHSVAAIPKGQTVPPGFHEHQYLALTPDRFDRVVFDALTDGLKETIEKSPEYQRLQDGGASAPADEPDYVLDDDIPF